MRPADDLNKEARSLGEQNRRQGEFCELGGCAKVRIGIVMVAPKLDAVKFRNEVITHEKSCCDIEVLVFRDMYDGVSNPHTAGRGEWWVSPDHVGPFKAEDVIPNTTEYRIYLSRKWQHGWQATHDELHEVKTHPLPHFIGSPFSSNSSSSSQLPNATGPWMRGYTQPFPKRNELPNPPAPIDEAMDFSAEINRVLAFDKDFGYACHSQGCNIVMHELLRACRK